MAEGRQPGSQQYSVLISRLFWIVWDYSNFCTENPVPLQNTQDSAHILSLDRNLSWSLSEIISHPSPSGPVLPPYPDNTYALEIILFICLLSLLQNQNINSRKTGIWVCSLFYSQHIEQDWAHGTCSLYICWVNDPLLRFLVLCSALDVHGWAKPEMVLALMKHGI